MTNTVQPPPINFSKYLWSASQATSNLEIRPTNPDTNCLLPALKTIKKNRKPEKLKSLGSLLKEQRFNYQPTGDLLLQCTTTENNCSSIFQNGSKQLWHILNPIPKKTNQSTATIQMSIRKRRNGSWEKTNMNINQLSKMRQIKVSFTNTNSAFQVHVNSSHESILLSTDSRKQGLSSNLSAFSPAACKKFEYVFYIVPQRLEKETSHISISVKKQSGNGGNDFADTFPIPIYSWDMRVACHQYESRTRTILKHNANTDSKNILLEL